MPTPTTNLGLTKPTLADTVRSWVTSLGSSLDALDALLGGGWTPYTPTYNFSVGNGTGTLGLREGRYKKVGRTVHFYARIRMGTGFTIGSGATIGLPVNRLGGVGDYECTAQLLDSGTTNYSAIGYMAPTGVSIWTRGTNGAYSPVGSTAPFTWAIGDEIAVAGTYESAT